MNLRTLLIFVLAMSAATRNVMAGFEITLGQTEVIPNTTPDGVPVYPWYPDGHLVFIPDTTQGQYQMYWAGSSSYRSTGTSLMNMTYTTGSASLPKGLAGEYDNGGAWLMSVFRKSGQNMIGFFHAEDHEFLPYSNPTLYAYKSIAVCTSANNGFGWTKGGRIITSATAKSATPAWGGVGDNCVVYDAANSRWVCYYATHYLQMAVSYDPNGAPGTWKKYYNKAFDEPGLGGRESPVPGLESRPGGNPSVHFNTYLNQWVMVWHSWERYGDQYLWLSTSTDMVNWRTPVGIGSVIGNAKMWYPTIVGSSDVEAGKDAWLCYGYWPDQASWPRQFVRRSISFESTATPSEPIGLAATASGNTVNLDWSNSAEPDLSHYTVYRSTTSNSGYAAIATGLTVSNYTDSSINAGTTYYYVVTATDTDGNQSAYSNQDSANTAILSNIVVNGDFANALGN